MSKAKQHREPLLSGGRMDNVIKDYLWNQKKHVDDILVMQKKGINPFNKEGTHYKKIVPVKSRFYNPLTGKIETVNIREHNKRVFAGYYNKKRNNTKRKAG